MESSLIVKCNILYGNSNSINDHLPVVTDIFLPDNYAVTQKDAPIM